MSIFVVDILESFLGDHKKHNESKGQISFDCPACAADKGLPDGDGKGNLEVNYNKGLFRCWACHYTNGMHGSIPKLIRRYGDGDLLNEYLILKPDTYKDFGNQKTNIITLPKGFHKLADCNPNRYKCSEAMKYLTERGLGVDIIKRFNIGYTVDDTEYMNRIIIPSYDAYGDLNYFVSRTFLKRVKPKYRNPEAEKDEIIFNEKLINWDSTIYLVEGPFDHLVIPNSIPLLGKYISDKLLYRLFSKASANIVIVLDADAYDDALTLYKQLNIGNLYGRIRFCSPPEGYDPSKIYELRGYKGVVKLLMTALPIPETELY